MLDSGGVRYPTPSTSENPPARSSARSSAENQLLQAQRQLLEQASDEEFKGLLRTHVDETHQQAENLERVSGQMGQERHSETPRQAGG